MKSAARQKRALNKARVLNMQQYSNNMRWGEEEDEDEMTQVCIVVEK